MVTSLLKVARSYDLEVKVNKLHGHSVSKVIDKIELNWECTFIQSVELKKDGFILFFILN